MKTLNRAALHLTNSKPIRILQFGGGNFLRGFFNWMVDILNDQAGFDGDVLLVKPTAGGGYEQLQDQDGLFHTILQNYSGEDIRLIKCIQVIIHPYQEWQKFLDTASLPLCRFMVSNTTESGIIYQHEVLDVSHPPSSFPAKLTIWLYQRFKEFKGDPSKGMIVLPTELIEDNGGKLKSCVLRLAKDWDLGNDFFRWIEQHNYFCNTLVDRIVSGFPKENAHKIQQTLGYKDQQLTVGESYHQWVIKAPQSIQSELPFNQTNLNVKFVEDLSPYRESKVRILNGAHTALVPIGMLAGLVTVYDVMTDAHFGKFIKELIHDEIVPTFTDPSIDAKNFAEQTILRFENPYINHQLKSISVNALMKFQVRLIPTVVLYLNKFNTYPRKIMLCWAALLYEDSDSIDDWNLKGLEKSEVITQLQLDLKNIHSLGIRKAVELI
jgi:tagaturonate reductase